MPSPTASLDHTFQALADGVSTPVYALGGVGLSDTAEARRRGGADPDGYRLPRNERRDATGTYSPTSTGSPAASQAESPPSRWRTCP